MTNKLFDDADDQTDVDIEIPADAPLRPFLEKYKDEAGLAKALLEKERFIRQLKDETAGLRSELTTRKSVEERLDQFLQTRNQQPPSNGGTPPLGNGDANANSPTNGLTLEDVQRLLEERTAASVASQNLNTAKAKLAEKFGSDWQKVLIDKGKEIGESQEFFEALAKKNPQALLALVGSPKSEPSNPNLTSGNVNTTQQALGSGVNGTVRNKAYYDAIKQKNATEYWSPRVQNQMHVDAMKLGEAFFT